MKNSNQIIKQLETIEINSLQEEELWEIEATYINFVVNNQIWKFYPKYEKWIKYSNNFSKIKEYFEII